VNPRWPPPSHPGLTPPWAHEGLMKRVTHQCAHVRYKIADVEAWEDAHYAEQAAG